MLFAPAMFRPVRRSLLSLLPCLLIVLSVLVSNTPTHATTQPTAGELDLSFQEPPLIGPGDVDMVIVQPDGKILIGGHFTTVNGVNQPGLARLNPDGSLDSTFTLPSFTDLIATFALQPDGKILIGGAFRTVNGVSRPYIARLNADGSLDPAFVPSGGPNFVVYAVTLQPDGKILIRGHFTTVNGVSRPGLARLNPDGSLDSAFAPSGGPNTWASMVVLQPDGKILIAGYPTTVNGVSRPGITRLNPDGSLDSAFAPTLDGYSSIYGLALQPDGKILIGGEFAEVNGISRSYIGRLHADGSLDPSFVPQGGPNHPVFSVALQPDGKILIGGDFTTVNGVSRPHLARLNADGTLDPAFAASAVPNGKVEALTLQADGKVIIGGTFTAINNTRRTFIIRLNMDSSLDTTFVVSSNVPSNLNAMIVQPDGKIVIGGDFGVVDDAGRSYAGIARLNADGSLDPSFALPSGLDYSTPFTLQPDGKILIGGWFTINGLYRPTIMRLNADGSLDPSFAPPDNFSDIISAALQPDGKILIGGAFSEDHGISRRFIARFNPDGSPDPSFAPPDGPDALVRNVVPQPDGKILIGGDFTTVNGVSRPHLARLNADGSLDSSFAPPVGPNDIISDFALQPDGKILTGGINDVHRAYIARLNADGSLDPSFAPPGGPDAWVYEIVPQPDGKILISGVFSEVNGISRQFIARLNTDGSLDPSFAPPGGPDHVVYGFALQSDGKILIWGGFTTVNGVKRPTIARLHNTIAAPKLVLSPTTTTAYQDHTFQLDLKFDTAGRVADTVDAYLSYDPALLEVIDAAGNPATSITENSAVVDSVTYNHVDRATGQIGFSASQSTSPYLTGSATVATIRFRAKAPTSSTSVQLVRSGVRQSDLFAGGTELQATLGHATVEIASGARLCGRIAVEQRGPAGTPRWITPLFRADGATTTGGVTLYQPGTSTEVGRFAVTTDADGRFCGTATGVVPGVYDVRVKGANTLSNQRANVDLRTATEVNFGTLRVGDSTGNDGVTGADVSYMIPSFFLRSGDTGFRPYADTNRDDEITGADVSALIPNFLQTGPKMVTGAVVAQPAPVRAAAATTPRIGLTPALRQLRVGEIAALDLQLHLDSLTADTIDLQIQVDPTLLEVVDSAGQPITKLTVDRTAFPDLSYNAVDTSSGTIRLSASRVRAGAVSGSLTIATLYVRAKVPFATTSIALTTTGSGRTDLFVQGQSLQPISTGSVLTTSTIHQVYLPAARD